LELGSKPSACLHAGSSFPLGDPPYAPVSKTGTTSVRSERTRSNRIVKCGHRFSPCTSKHARRARTSAREFVSCLLARSGVRATVHGQGAAGYHVGSRTGEKHHCVGDL